MVEPIFLGAIGKICDTLSLCHCNWCLLNPFFSLVGGVVSIYYGWLVIGSKVYISSKPI